VLRCADLGGGRFGGRDWTFGLGMRLSDQSVVTCPRF
jgi:hypothetical protein